VIAIDGPAGAGKSTAARALAQRLGCLYVDTGAMYRALTLKVVESGQDPGDEVVVSELAKTTDITLVPASDGSGVWVFLDGSDVTGRIRSPQVNRAVSVVSSYPAVRHAMAALQRRMAENGGAVLEGRDIGTFVYPEADVKFFITASLAERAKRRHKEMAQLGFNQDIAEVAQDMAARDKLDANRALAPLRAARDAFVVDTTFMTPGEVVEVLLEKVKEVAGSCCIG